MSEPLITGPSATSSDRDACMHGIAFDEEAARGMNSHDVRKRWPRLMGRCEHCGYDGIYYASWAHFIAGDW